MNAQGRLDYSWKAHDAGCLRLRDLTDYVYQMITKAKADPN